MNGEGALPTVYGLYLLQTLLALGAVCILAVVVLRLLSRRLHGGRRGGRHLRVIEHLPLDQRRTLYLVEAAGRSLLLGATDGGGVRLIAELDRLDQEPSAAAAPEEPPLSDAGEPGATTTTADRSPDPG